MNIPIRFGLPAGHEIETQRLMFDFFWWAGVWVCWI